MICSIDYEKKQLAKVFNTNMLNIYENRTFKGLEMNSDVEVKKFGIGKTGIPIKYEDLPQENINK